jgi:hypothetical protein
MAKDTDKLKDLTDDGDEDFPDFIFAHDLLGEEGEEEEMEEKTIELVNVMEEGTIPESVEQDTELFEELVLDEEEVREGFGAKTEPFLTLEEDLSLDMGFDELLSERDAGEVKEPRAEEAAREETQDTEGTAEEVLAGMPPTEKIVKEEEAPLSISEEQIEALLTKIVTDVLERATRAIIIDVAEKVINEEIDALKNSITSLD